MGVKMKFGPAPCPWRSYKDPPSDPGSKLVLATVTNPKPYVKSGRFKDGVWQVDGGSGSKTNWFVAAWHVPGVPVDMDHTMDVLHWLVKTNHWKAADQHWHYAFVDAWHDCTISKLVMPASKYSSLLEGEKLQIPYSNMMELKAEGIVSNGDNGWMALAPFKFDNIPVHPGDLLKLISDPMIVGSGISEKIFGKNVKVSFTIPEGKKFLVFYDTLMVTPAVYEQLKGPAYPAKLVTEIAEYLADPANSPEQVPKPKILGMDISFDPATGADEMAFVSYDNQGNVLDVAKVVNLAGVTTQKQALTGAAQAVALSLEGGKDNDFWPMIATPEIYAPVAKVREMYDQWTIHHLPGALYQDINGEIWYKHQVINAYHDHLNNWSQSPWIKKGKPSIALMSWISCPAHLNRVAVLHHFGWQYGWPAGTKAYDVKIWQENDQSGAYSTVRMSCGLKLPGQPKTEFEGYLVDAA